ncbi:hypothetical protein F5B20DRAFT_454216 [Whalleya microplaca]|nr:hypothetical protein F5B20DRAFT_454216 [Whalleya microplaca]
MLAAIDFRECHRVVQCPCTAILGWGGWSRWSTVPTIIRVTRVGPIEPADLIGICKRISGLSHLLPHQSGLICICSGLQLGHNSHGLKKELPQIAYVAIFEHSHRRGTSS